MEIASILNDIGQRFSASRKKKKEQPNPLLQEIGNRFNSFLQSQTQPQVAGVRFSPQTIDSVGQRFQSFMSGGQKTATDIGTRFADYLGRKPLVPQLGKYSPTTGQAADFLADIPRDIARVGFEGAQTLSGDYNTYQFKDGLVRQILDDRPLYNYNDPRRPGREFAKNIGHEELGTPLVLLGAAASVTPMGAGKGKIAKEVAEEGFEKVGLTAAQKAARDKLPKILFETAEERTAKRLGIKLPDIQNFFRRPDAPQRAERLIHSIPNTSDDWKAMFREWVNTRSASQMRGILQKSNYKQLDDEGITGIFRFQAGDKSGDFARVKKFFDTKFEQLNKLNINTNYKQDYLPGIWLNTKEEVEEKLGRNLGLRPGFTMKSVIEDYATGIANGLTPKFTKLSDLVGWYEQRTSKAMADKKFFDYLKTKNLILPESQAPRWWRTVDPDRFPKETVKTGTETITENWKAEPTISDAINNYLTDDEGLLSTFANLATRVKNIGLAAGVPNTSLNFHGLNLYVRGVLAANNPVGQMYKSARWFFQPGTAQKYVEQNLAKAHFFAKHGMTVTTEDYGLYKGLQEVNDNIIKGSAGKVFTKFEEWFGDPLLQKTVPALKTQYASELYQDLVKSMSSDEAAKLAAKTANNVFGGINLDELMRAKPTRNFFRSLILAPDWSESTIRVGGGILKGLANPLSPEYKAYRTIARNLTFAYISTNIVNKMLSGHWQFENEGNNKFNIDTGTFTDDGKKRYFRPFGTAVDFVRLPVQIIEGLSKGDPTEFVNTFANRFSMPVSAGLHLLGNQDYLHRPIYGKDKYGNEIPATQAIGGIANELAQGLGVPTQIRAGVDVMTGKSNIEQGIMQALEVPVRYAGGAYSDKQKERVEDYQAVGLNGEEIHNALKGKKEEKEGFFSGILNFFGLGQKEETETEITDPLLKSFETELDNDKKASRIREIFKDPAYRGNKELIEKALQEEELGSYKEASVYIMKSLGVESGSRWNFIQEYTNGMNEQDKLKTLYWLAEEGVLTTATISQAVDDELLSEDEADYLRDLIKLTKGTYKEPKGKKAKTPTLKSGGSLPTINAPTFSTQGYQFKQAPYRPVKQAQPLSQSIRPLEVRKAPEPVRNYGRYN